VNIVRIDPALKAVSRALRSLCLRDVEARETSPALEEELRACEERTLRLPDPRSVIRIFRHSCHPRRLQGARKRPRALSRLCGSVDSSNCCRQGIAAYSRDRGHHYIVSVESRVTHRIYDLAHVRGDITFRARPAREKHTKESANTIESGGLPLFADELGPHGSATAIPNEHGHTARARFSQFLFLSVARKICNFISKIAIVARGICFRNEIVSTSSSEFCNGRLFPLVRFLHTRRTLPLYASIYGLKPKFQSLLRP